MAKENKYDDEGHLIGMDVGDWIVTIYGRVRRITSDNMPDLPYFEIGRYATDEEILKAGGKPTTKAEALPIAGVSLRDELAMAALTGLLANPKYFNPDQKHEMITEPRIFERAYSMADGMLKARHGG